MARETSHTHVSLRFKMAAFVGMLIVALLIIDTLWAIRAQQQQAENEMFEKAQVIAREMRAAWDFIDINQESINRAEDGTLRTKTLVCVVASKSISTLFTANSDYTIRFVNTNPRQVANTPDEFEAEALQAFRDDPELTSYYGMYTNDGTKSYRYVEPLYVTESCLECHGDPAGEKDQYGYTKEGMQLGDIGGAMSIIEPTSIYIDAIRASIIRQVVTVLIILLVASFGVYLAASRIILNPVETLRDAVHAIGGGSFNQPFDVDTPNRGGTDEITELADDVRKMSSHMESLTSDLQGAVDAQTDELKLLNEKLLSQQAELQDAITSLNEEKEYKNEFFATVSHELRTPLTSIIAFARILKDDEQLDDKTREAVSEIESNSTLLLNLVNNILTISKTEAQRNQLVLEPVDFVDLIGYVRSSLDPIAKNKDITLTAQTGANVPLSMADWEKLRRVIENLVDNAIKYTHRGGAVDVDISFDAEASLDLSPIDGLDGMSEGVIAIAVSDDGVGVSPEDQELIFNLYEQVGKSSNRRFRGTGLGLAVVKQLTQMHAGTIELESELKKGSTFTIRIPYIPVDTEEYDEDNACR